MERRRFRAARLFEAGQSAPDVARRLGAARQVVHRWMVAWRQGGRKALASRGRAGRKSRLSPELSRKVSAALAAGPLSRGARSRPWTLARTAALIEDLTGVRYHPGHVWKLLKAEGNRRLRPGTGMGGRRRDTPPAA